MIILRSRYEINGYQARKIEGLKSQPPAHENANGQRIPMRGSVSELVEAELS